MLDGAAIVYGDRLPGPHAPPLPFRLGGWHVAYATAMGKAMLAHLVPDELEAVCPPTLLPVTPRTTTDRATLERDLAAVRETGLASDRVGRADRPAATRPGRPQRRAQHHALPAADGHPRAPSLEAVLSPSRGPRTRAR